MSNNFREHIIYWYQDVARCIDYLETREDLDRDAIGYYGTSWGAVMGAIIPALEQRIKACVLVVGGFWQQRGPPETEQINFAPHVTATSQAPMFRWLGSLEGQKLHILYESGHSIPRIEGIKESLNWFDRYLGKVN